MKRHSIGFLVFLLTCFRMSLCGLFVDQAHAAHFLHTTPIILGPNVVEASKIEAIFITSLPNDLVIEAVVKNGRYNTKVETAIAAIGNTGDDSAISSGTYSDKNRSRVYTIKVTTAGSLGAAAISWTTDKLDDEGGPVIIPASGTVGVGTKGVKLTLGFGLDGVLSLNNAWTVSCTREFVETAPSQRFIYRGLKSASIAMAVPDPLQQTIFGVVVKKAYGSIGSDLGWSGSIQAIDEY